MGAASGSTGATRCGYSPTGPIATRRSSGCSGDRCARRLADIFVLQSAPGVAILRGEFGDEFCDGTDGRDRTDALARSPDVLPRLRLGVAARAEIHRFEIAPGQIVGVHTRRGDRLADILSTEEGRMGKEGGNTC